MEMEEVVWGLGNSIFFESFQAPAPASYSCYSAHLSPKLSLRPPNSSSPKAADSHQDAAESVTNLC